MRSRTRRATGRRPSSGRCAAIGRACPQASLQPGYTGIRPKIYRKGEPVPDFAIHGAAEHGIERLVALYGIESPGLTSSLAIGEHVAGMLAAVP